MMEKSLDRLESLGIPTVVLQGLNCSNPPRIEALSSVIKIVGQIFDQPEKAATLADYLENSVQRIAERTREISEKDQPEILMLGLDPQLRAQGTVGTVYGSRDVHSYFVEQVVNARNAFQGELATATMSLEHLFKIDPDVIILPTANGYHPPRELYEESFFQNLRALRAIRDRRVAALPWSPCNCDKRLEYPVDIYIIAVTAYPELFPDLNLTEWVLQFYQGVYGLDPSTADGLLSAQWLDWLRELD
jgi:iron complex transport system substrate-binding protein